MLSHPMPFPRVPCRIYLPQEWGIDAYGNEITSYPEFPDIETECSYAPGRYSPDTENDIEDGRPHGVQDTVTFYLPKTLDVDLRGALIQVLPPDDARMASLKFRVVGDPHSYMRGATPGDMSWSVEGVRFDG